MKYHVLLIILVFLICLVIFPLSLFFSFQYFSKATDIKAAIFIDTNQSLGPMRPIWKSYVQGGGQTISPFVNKIQTLEPRYIRIDHIFDAFDVVSRDTIGKLQFKWDKLDAEVCSLYKTGAKPFFVLGYMPSALSTTGSLVDPPTKWEEWSLLVQKTIEHYSGKNTILCGTVKGQQLSDIYYEVWNEPDLNTFGKWSMGNIKKDYTILYKASVTGANQAQNVWHFSIGGPALSSLFPTSLTLFLDSVTQQKLRLDFISWHRYAHASDSFQTDAAIVEKIFSKAPYLQYRGLSRLITEWGFDSNMNEGINAKVVAAHTIASVRNMIDYPFEQVLSFELVDNPQTNWGIFTLQGEPKSRYDALLLLNRLQGERLQVSGEGTYVQALASKQNSLIHALLVNYDSRSINSEIVPITFTNLKPGSYQLLITDVTGKAMLNQSFPTVSDQLRIQIPLPYNTIVYMKLNPIDQTPIVTPSPVPKPSIKQPIIRVTPRFSITIP